MTSTTKQHPATVLASIVALVALSACQPDATPTELIGAPTTTATTSLSGELGDGTGVDRSSRRGESGSMGHDDRPVVARPSEGVGSSEGDPSVGVGVWGSPDTSPPAPPASSTATTEQNPADAPAKATVPISPSPTSQTVAKSAAAVQPPPTSIPSSSTLPTSSSTSSTPTSSTSTSSTSQRSLLPAAPVPTVPVPASPAPTQTMVAERLTTVSVEELSVAPPADRLIGKWRLVAIEATDFGDTSALIPSGMTMVHQPLTSLFTDAAGTRMVCSHTLDSSTGKTHKHSPGGCSPGGTTLFWVGLRNLILLGEAEGTLVDDDTLVIRASLLDYSRWTRIG